MTSGLVYILDDDPAVGATISLVAQRCGLATRAFNGAQAFLDAVARLMPICRCCSVILPQSPA